MCGIGYIKRNDNHSPIRSLLKSYEEQKSRGQRGFGFVAVKNNKVIGYERSEEEAQIKEKLGKFHHADEILFHHRLPTSTGNYEETAHPIFVSNKMLKYVYYVVHNGVISNASALKEKHTALGFNYDTEVEVITGYRKVRMGKTKERVEVTKKEFNDSESLAIELALYFEGHKNEVDTVGSVAFIALQVDADTQEIVNMYYGRNINPLNSFSAHGMFTLWSQSKIKTSEVVEPYRLYRIGRGSDKSKSSESFILSSGISTPQKHTYTHSHVYKPIGYDTTRVMEIPKCTHGNTSSITCSKCAEEKMMSYGKQNVPLLPTPSPYTNDKCVVCKKEINQFQTKVWDNDLQKFIHHNCGAIKAEQSTQATLDEVIYQERDNLEDELDKINAKIEETEQIVGLMEDDNSPQMIEEWFKKSEQLTKLEYQRESIVERLETVERTISNLVF